jgi:iron complex outermembrane receptor protein
VQGEARLAASAALGELRLSAYAGYTRGENRTTGDNLYHIMPLNARLALEQKKGGFAGKVEGEFVSAKNKVSAVRQEMRTGGYALMHLRGSYQWRRVRVDFGVDNVFDRGYDLPLGGAYVGQGSTMTIPALPNQPQWGTPVPGPGRSLYVGFNVSL